MPAASFPASSVAPDFLTEHQIFWMLVNKAARRDEIGRVYLAIQAALAFGRETVDVGWLMGSMLADGRRVADSSCEALGAGGLAYFHWLYEVELISTGDADYHHYRFRRRHDGASTTAYLRSTPVPRSLQAQQEYERERRRLATKREQLLAVYRSRR